MRYAIIEILPPLTPTSPVRVLWVATDLSKSSANDAIHAWNYQAGRKGGYMEIIEDCQYAFDTRNEEAQKYAFISRRSQSKGV